MDSTTKIASKTEQICTIKNQTLPNSEKKKKENGFQ